MNTENERQELQEKQRRYEREILNPDTKRGTQYALMSALYVIEQRLAELDEIEFENRAFGYGSKWTTGE